MGIFGKHLTSTTFNLASAKDSVGLKTTDSRPASLTSEPGRRMIDYFGIDSLYMSDSVTFNIINKMVQWTMKPMFEFRSAKKYLVTSYTRFFDNLGKIGEEITKEDLVEYSIKDLFMYGNSFIELVFGDLDGEEIITDLRNIPARNVDYARDSRGDVAIDEFGKPVGYMIQQRYGSSLVQRGDTIPKPYDAKITKQSNSFFLLPKRIAHFKINAFGDRYWGVGMVQPTVLNANRKQKIEEAQANSIYTRGTGPVIAKVGDERHEATENDLKSVLGTLQNMKHDRYMALPHFVDIKPLEIQQSDIGGEALKYLAMGQAAAAGMPGAFALGGGEATNRATLNNQQQMFELVLEYYIKQFTNSFNKMIIRRINVINDVGGIVDMKWGDIKAQELNDKSQRLSAAITEGSLSPEEVRKYRLKSEDIEEDEKAYKEFKESKKVADNSYPISNITKKKGFEEDEKKKEITENTQ